MTISNQLRRIIKVMGPQRAVRLVRYTGNKAYHVPHEQNLHDLHPLVVAIGMEAALAFCREFEAEHVTIPGETNALQQIRDDHIAERYRAGDSISSIGREVGLDRKMIQKIIDRRGVVRLGKSLHEREIEMKSSRSAGQIKQVLT